MKKLFLFILPAILLIACGNEPKEENINDTTTLSTEEKKESTTKNNSTPKDYVAHAEDEYGMTHEEYEKLAAQARPPQLGKLIDGNWQAGNDELTDILSLLQIGDGAYPSFSVEAMPSQQEEAVWFYLNAEDYVGTPLNELMDNIGKNIKVAYWIREQNLITGKVINEHTTNRVVLESNSDEKTLIGKWIAEDVSQGDLPDNIYIETSNGLRVAFPAFISEEDVALNGKTVTVNYTTRVDMVISYIKLLED